MQLNENHDCEATHPGLSHKEWQKMEDDKKIPATDNEKWATLGISKYVKEGSLGYKKALRSKGKKKEGMRGGDEREKSMDYRRAEDQRKKDNKETHDLDEAIGDGKKKSKGVRKMDIAVSKVDRAFRNKKSNPPGSARAKQRVNSAAFSIKMGRDPEEMKQSKYHTKADVRSAEKFLKRVKLNELKKDTLKSYVKKAGEDVRRTEYQKGRAGERYAQANVDMQTADPDNPRRNDRQLAARRKAQAVADYNKLGPRTTKRMKGIAKALGKLEEESVEVNELTNKTIRSYLGQVKEDMSKYDSYDDWRAADFPTKKKIKKKMTKIKLAKGKEIGWEMKDAATGKVLKKGGPAVTEAAMTQANKYISRKPIRMDARPTAGRTIPKSERRDSELDSQIQRFSPRNRLRNMRTKVAKTREELRTRPVTQAVKGIASRVGLPQGIYSLPQATRSVRPFISGPFQ